MFETYSEEPTSTLSLTDPDQPTASVETSIAQATPSTVNLPEGMPARIFPANRLTTEDTLDGYTMVSIKFNLKLSWRWVTSNSTSSSQIFAYMPEVLRAGLGISENDIRTFALQVYRPASYHSTADVGKLATLYLAFIPTARVNDLAGEIKFQRSALYTQTSGIAAQLADCIDPGFNVLSVAPPAELGNNNSAASNSGGASSDQRQDAIIGVVTSLGGIALIVLVFLVYRTYKRRQELAHRRLSDPIANPGIRPEGREFDRDSVGGYRRRSFYFAEDSLRGYQESQQQDNMTQRRPVMPSAISAPVLRENTLNW